MSRIKVVRVAELVDSLPPKPQPKSKYAIMLDEAKRNPGRLYVIRRSAPTSRYGSYLRKKHPGFVFTERVERGVMTLYCSYPKEEE